MFPIALWNNYERVIHDELLTTNNAEHFHRKFKHNIVQGVHPSIPTFLEHLKSQQALTSNDMVSFIL